MMNSVDHNDLSEVISDIQATRMVYEHDLSPTPLVITLRALYRAAAEALQEIPSSHEYDSPSMNGDHPTYEFIEAIDKALDRLYDRLPTDIHDEDKEGCPLRNSSEADLLHVASFFAGYTRAFERWAKHAGFSSRRAGWTPLDYGYSTVLKFQQFLFEEFLSLSGREVTASVHVRELIIVWRTLPYLRYIADAAQPVFRLEPDLGATVPSEDGSTD